LNPMKALKIAAMLLILALLVLGVGACIAKSHGEPVGKPLYWCKEKPCTPEEIKSWSNELKHHRYIRKHNVEPDAGTINYYFCLVAIAIIPFAVLAFFWPCIHRRYNTNFSVRVSDSAALTFEPKTLMFQTKGEPRGCLPCDSKGIELKAVFEPSHAGKTVQIKDGKVSFEEKQYRVNWRTPAPANEKMGMPVSLKIKNVPPLKQDRAPQTLIVIEHDFGKVVLERETVEDGERGEYESWSFDNPIKDVPKKEQNKCKTCNGTCVSTHVHKTTPGSPATP